MIQPLTPEHLADLDGLRDAAHGMAEILDDLTYFDENLTEHTIWNMGLLAGQMNRVLHAHTGYTLIFSPTTDPEPEPEPVDTSSLIAEAESLLASATEGPWSTGTGYGAVISTSAVPTDFELEHGYFKGYGGVMVCESVRVNNAAFIARSHGLVTELVAALKAAQ